MELLYIWGKVLSNLYLKVTKTVLMNDYCRKDTMVKLYIKTFFFLKDNLIAVLKQLFTRIYWCFVINYRFKIVQIVTHGPMIWPLDQYLTLLTNDFNTWPLNQWRDPRNKGVTLGTLTRCFDGQWSCGNGADFNVML